MFPPFKPLNHRLGRLLQEVERVHGPQSLVFNRVENAVRDFPAQPTIWDAYEGRKPLDEEHRPPEFRRLFDEWLSAYDNLVSQDAHNDAGLNAAVDRVKESTRAVLAPLYRAKEAMLR